jgi:hypothetical protein
MMMLRNRLGKTLGQARARNQKCQCGSGLKFKHCHGDQEKRQKVSTIANLAMTVLINYRRQKAGLVDEDTCDTQVARIQEMMYNILDPDYVPPEPEDTPAKTEVVESEDKQREDAEEEAEPEPEVTGQDKIKGIREAAGIDRCPGCGGVKQVEKDQCYKCKKGQA